MKVNGTSSMGPTKAPPSIFSRIKRDSRSTCAFCGFAWDLILKDMMLDGDWVKMKQHLEQMHGWKDGEIAE